MGKSLRTLPPRFSKLDRSLVLFLCLVFTGLSAFLVSYIVRRQSRERLEASATILQNNIRSRLERYENSLLQMRAHFIVAPSLNQDRFQRYVHNLNLLEKYPGIQGLGYAKRVQASEIADHEKDVRSNGLPNYEVWPTGQSTEHFPIVLLEPFNWRNRRALGYDMFEEPTRRAAMERALNTGNPSVSGVVRLVQETDQDAQPGFLMYVPVYADGTAPESADARREAVRGFVYAPFRAKDLFSAVVNRDLELQRSLRLRIYDGTQQDPENLLFENSQLSNPDDLDSGSHALIREFATAGRTWTFVVEPKRSFTLSSERYAPFAVGGAGTLFSLLVFGMLSSARKHAEFESRSRETLEQINRISRIISGELNLKTLIQCVTDAATAVTKADFGAFFYNDVNELGETYTLYAISGVDRSAFDKFPMPRKTKIFETTFNGTGVLRSDDITADPRYGKNAPYKGMPEGHLPVRSYLAVPVISRSGEVLGGLFFGHKEIKRFTEREEIIVQGIASHTAVALDNARLYKTAQDAIKARDEFLSICSHELKTPITSLKLQAQLASLQISRFGKIDERQVHDMATNMDKQLDQLTRLVEDMLDIARIETGHLSLVQKNLDLAQLARDVIKRFEPQAANTGVGISLHAEEEISVYGDPDRLTQVLMNLLSNALKYGDGKPIEMRVTRGDGTARIDVRDFGIGVPESERSRIFERFERVVAYRNISGLGLGLFITRQIVEAHGGQISIQTPDDGVGSLFTLELPRVEDTLGRSHRSTRAFEERGAQTS